MALHTYLACSAQSTKRKLIELLFGEIFIASGAEDLDMRSRHGTERLKIVLTFGAC